MLQDICIDLVRDSKDVVTTVDCGYRPKGVVKTAECVNEYEGGESSITLKVYIAFFVFFTIMGLIR